MRYIVKKKNLLRLHKSINEYFERAPKSLEELVSSPSYIPPIPVGMTYKEFERDERILSSLFQKHNEKICDCNFKQKCLFKSYADKEASREDVLKLYKS